MVCKQFCVNQLFFLYSYSKSIFNLCSKSTQEFIDHLFFASLQVKDTQMLSLYISEFKLGITLMCWLSTVREPALVWFVFALNVSEVILNMNLEMSH